ncbi:MAG TPA: SDR family oxidoreductase [Bacteroidales bacterium]|nr:SDR family oxidoreductase [Bacteroidales bacterium]
MGNKTAVITGGTKGIGASMVADFLRNGWNVSYSGTSDASLKQSLEKLEGRFTAGSYEAFKCDVRNEEEIISLWNNTIKVFGRVDIWVNNAGRANEQQLFHMIPSALITGIVDTNIKGLMLATNIAYNNMLIQGSGAIYNMAGLGSDGRMIPGLTPYGTTKRAVQYFTCAFAKEIKGSPVLIGTINPGMVLTDLTMSQVRKNPEANTRLIKIYNILANDPEDVTPWLVKKMIDNTRNGAEISFFKKKKVLLRFLAAPFSKRDIVTKHLEMKK